MEAFLTYLSTEWRVITDAPLIFVTGGVLIGLVVYAGVRAMFGDRLSNMEGRIAFRDDRIADYERKLDGATPDQAGARIEALEGKLTDLANQLADMRQSQAQSAPALAPISVRNLRHVPSGELRVMIHDVARRMREMELTFLKARPRIHFGATSKGEWEAEVNELEKRTYQHRAQWQSELMPEASALWREAKYRIFGHRPAGDDDHYLVMTLEHGSLAGPEPLHDSASALEKLAQKLPD